MVCGFDTRRVGHLLHPNERAQAVPVGFKSGSAKKLRVPHISLVFCEMWDTTALDPRILEPSSHHRESTGAPRSPKRPPDFLSSLPALAHFMRLSLMKAAHAGVGGAPCRKSGYVGRKRWAQPNDRIRCIDQQIHIIRAQHPSVRARGGFQSRQIHLDHPHHGLHSLGVTDQLTNIAWHNLPA
jgi:hypothetical protein